jgi:hypothetical protein
VDREPEGPGWIEENSEDCERRGLRGDINWDGDQHLNLLFMGDDDLHQCIKAYFAPTKHSTLSNLPVE